jgi:hypothetical protein
MPQFDGTEGGQISLQQGADLTASYRLKFPNATKGRFFGKEILQQILDQPGCVGIRMYFGVKKEESGSGHHANSSSSGSNNQAVTTSPIDLELVLVGANGNQDDMLDIIADISVPCPSFCGSQNSLNS